MDSIGHPKEPSGDPDRTRRFNYFASYLFLILGIVGLAFTRYIYFQGTNWLALMIYGTMSGGLVILSLIFLVWLKIQKE